MNTYIFICTIISIPFDRIQFFWLSLLQCYLRVADNYFGKRFFSGKQCINIFIFTIDCAMGSDLFTWNLQSKNVAMVVFSMVRGF